MQCLTGFCYYIGLYMSVCKYLNIYTYTNTSAHLNKYAAIHSKKLMFFKHLLHMYMCSLTTFLHVHNNKYCTLVKHSSFALRLVYAKKLKAMITNI